MTQLFKAGDEVILIDPDAAGASRIFKMPAGERFKVAHLDIPNTMVVIHPSLKGNTYVYKAAFILAKKDVVSHMPSWF